MSADTTPDKIGVYRNVPAGRYHSWQAFSISAGLELIRSPGHYLHRILNPIIPTAAMQLGTLLHMRVLEPERFFDTTIFVPEHIPKDRRTKARKEWEENLGLVSLDTGQTMVKQGYPGRFIIESEEARKIDAMYQSIMSRTVAREILTGEGEVELSLLWNSEDVVCKGRIDKVHVASRSIVDIKTTQDASPQQFEKTVCNRGYHIQCAHYLDGAQSLGVDVEHAIIIAVESEAPFGVGVYALPLIAMRAGLSQRNKLLEVLKKCIDSNDWPSYPDEVQVLDFPAWAFSSIERALGYY